LDYNHVFSKPLTWPATAVDAVGDTVCNPTACSLLTHYTSSNSNVATIDDDGYITPIGVGQSVLTATTLAYGVAKHDSVVFTIGYRLYYDMYIYLTSVLGVLTLGYKAPKVLFLGVGATINFCAPGSNPTDQYRGYPVDVIFDKPALIDTATTIDPSLDLPAGSSLPPNGSGNIAPFACDTAPDGSCPQTDSNHYRSRRFPVAGTYHYHSSLYPSDTFTLMIKEN
jgi:hypothetical protein